MWQFTLLSELPHFYYKISLESSVVRLDHGIIQYILVLVSSKQ